MIKLIFVVLVLWAVCSSVVWGVKEIIRTKNKQLVVSGVKIALLGFVGAILATMFLTLVVALF